MPLTTREEIIQLRALLVGWSNNAMQLVTIRHSRGSSYLRFSVSLSSRTRRKNWLSTYISIWHRWQGSKGESRLADEWSKRDKIVIVDPGLRDWKEVINDRGYPRAANATDERMNCWKLCWHIVRHRIGSKVGVTQLVGLTFFDFGTIRAINSYRALWVYGPR